MQNPFIEGQKVVCFNDHFPLIKEYGGAGDTKDKPKKGEILIIDEILGEYLRFEKYDTEESVNWWFYNRFAPINSTEADVARLESAGITVHIP